MMRSKLPGRRSDQVSLGRLFKAWLWSIAAAAAEEEWLYLFLNDHYGAAYQGGMRIS
jgi:hypothetical protein